MMNPLMNFWMEKPDSGNVSRDAQHYDEIFGEMPGVRQEVLNNLPNVLSIKVENRLLECNSY